MKVIISPMFCVGVSVSMCILLFDITKFIQSGLCHYFFSSLYLHFNYFSNFINNNSFHSRMKESSKKRKIRLGSRKVGGIHGKGRGLFENQSTVERR